MPVDAPSTRRALIAYVGPFALFCALLVLPDLCRAMHPPAGASPWMTAPEFWVYPLQTLLCGAALLAFRRRYPSFATRGGLAFGAAVGVAVLLIWIAPQALFHARPRTAGFDPVRLAGTFARPLGGASIAYGFTVTLRFVRLVVVVPWLEEVFWRGFLLRYLIDENFLAVRFGAFSTLSFALVTAGFTLEHSVADYPAACAAGALYNLVAMRTRSLPACIAAHAVTNALLGIYVMRTHQWGFW